MAKSAGPSKLAGFSAGAAASTATATSAPMTVMDPAAASLARLDAFTKAYADLDLLRQTKYSTEHARSCLNPLRLSAAAMHGISDSVSDDFMQTAGRCAHCDNPKNAVCKRCGVYDKASGALICRPCFYHAIISNKFE